ncbi:hypothetical protein AUEXF2481DRAFT_28403 [Aureobasidium subglaciale EXF-2481]|uniref:Uncharacterized protein n=1 Tax=Aureobasidium subglaciale (strain EXF-2481) TaxID=1043005 RepID=A0A074ZCP3_AURSE|nr:uncharacterized protein AUEXF2481DRAFT_28403 [Aureobasidium subglaciale EXF-2481]KEQ96456.1 hypothetical protein AUEXF2481DRAFT_28403 [Aureobasidium subglaciale EXF-2481]
MQISEKDHLECPTVTGAGGLSTDGAMTAGKALNWKMTIGMALSLSLEQVVDRDTPVKSGNMAVLTAWQRTSTRRESPKSRGLIRLGFSRPNWQLRPRPQAYDLPKIALRHRILPIQTLRQYGKIPTHRSSPHRSNRKQPYDILPHCIINKDHRQACRRSYSGASPLFVLTVFCLGTYDGSGSNSTTRPILADGPSLRVLATL